MKAKYCVLMIVLWFVVSLFTNPGTTVGYMLTVLIMAIITGWLAKQDNAETLAFEDESAAFWWGAVFFPGYLLMRDVKRRKAPIWFLLVALIIIVVGGIL